MFSLFSGIYSHYFSPTPLNILLLGPSNSGKTALLERVKVTEFHEPKKNRGQNIINTASENSQTGGNAQRPATQQRTNNNMTTTTMTANTNDEGVPRIMKRRLLACPTPFMGQKYMNHEEEGHAQDDHHDDENATDDANIPLNLSEESWSLPQSSQQQLDVRTSSLEDVLINTTNEEEGEHEQQQFDDDDNKQHNSNTATTMTPTSTDESLNQHNSDINSIEQEFDLKKGAKMLPLDKIRPTIGCNLAKNVIIQNCVCKVFDVGGSMQELWPQYYNDADCVVFVVCNNNKNVKLLEQVRRDIPDDVPFLIFVHDMMQDEGVSNNNNDLLPHYHSNLMRIHHGNAKTGEGVRDAFEWLVQCAKRQAQLKKTSTK